MTDPFDAPPNLPMKAETVLMNYWDGTIPVNPVDIALRMGVQVYKDPFLDVSGSYSEESNQPVIVFNPNEALTRMRFTVAHELGHHALQHGQSFRDGRLNFDRNNFQRSEVEANKFAAELLMPSESVHSLALQDGQTVSSLACCFGVSTVAMEIRLKVLGIIDDD